MTLVMFDENSNSNILFTCTVLNHKNYNAMGRFDHYTPRINKRWRDSNHQSQGKLKLHSPKQVSRPLQRSFIIEQKTNNLTSSTGMLFVWKTTQTHHNDDTRILHRRLPSWVEGQKDRHKPSNEEQSACYPDGHRRDQVGVQCDDWCHYSEDAVPSCSQSVSRPTIFGGEQLGRNGVEDAIHHVAHKTIPAVPSQERVRRARRRAREQEDTGKH